MLLHALRSVKRGNFSTRLFEWISGIEGKVAQAFDDSRS
jgi:hypothetical protein